MADNYLENKMEEYRRGTYRKHYQPRLSPNGQKAGTISFKFPQRRVFVTGGANGIGKAVVTEFRNANCNVAFCDIDTKNGNITAQATGAQFYHVDITNPEALESCLKKITDSWGDIDIIVNNAGISEFKSLDVCTASDFDRIIATNLRPAFITSRFLYTHRRSLAVPEKYGRIINIASTRAFMSEPGTEAYSTSKGGIIALTHSLMMSFANMGVTVNSISPGWIETKNYNALTPDEHRQHPSNRVGTPQDISRTCLWLAMEENSFINGENIVIDGGITRKMIYV
ncbi:MAG: SDR family oxidoreductase [Muribaculum sp.]|nr:SDR family oxidoreductase [Muribaculaceae bacterium]MCM1081369.1 SDR family oxidoreductase [Muribaculum sp.]